MYHIQSNITLRSFHKVFCMFTLQEDWVATKVSFCTVDYHLLKYYVAFSTDIMFWIYGSKELSGRCIGGKKETLYLEVNLAVLLFCTYAETQYTK